ncbi:cohesin complex subunit [Cryptotrichosporon argae]
MSDDEDAPRRGSRVRKQVDRFAVGASDSSESEEDRPARRAKKAKKAAGATTPTVPKRRRKQGAAGGMGGEKTSERAAAGDVPEGFKDDSPLFNALLSPDVAIQPLVEDWVETYRSAEDEDAERSAVHELVLFFIRCSGLGAEVEVDEALDLDGVQDVIERIQDESVKTNAATYPLINRKIAKTFKSNLDSVVSHLITTLSLGPLLYETSVKTTRSAPILTVLLAWLHVMTTSPLRPIRHTSTYITLKINSALCQITAKVVKEISLKKRQREADNKKGGKRSKEVDSTVKEAEARKEVLHENMREISSVMFVHRIRDADPAIRTECLRELGVWVKRYPETYATSSFLSYFGRGCNDPDTSARLETVKALSSLFSTNAPSSAALRLISRLVEMALRDVDTSIRVNALKVITTIDETGVLQDEDEGQETRESVARLLFDVEPRVRRAVAPFVKNLWDERVAKLTTSFESYKGTKKKRAEAVGETAVQLKPFATLLVETAKAIDDEQPGSSKVALPASDGTTRAAAAVEALYDSFECLQDWQGLVDYLLLDHSSSDEWLLEDDEEDFMIDVLVACIKRDEAKDKTSLMESLPRLLKKHHAEPRRLAALLAIPTHMDLSQYLETRKTKQYEALWDDITKQFLSQTDSAVLTAAVLAISRLATNTSMSAINDTKRRDLDEALFKSLRDAIGGEEVSNMAIDEDTAASFEAALLRLSLVARSRDIVEAMEDDEGDQSTGWTIVTAFAGRAGLGYKEEAKLVEHAVQIVMLHISWMFKRQDERLDARRDEALKILEHFGLERTNAGEAVRRQAFISFLNLHILFRSKLEIAEETQHKLSAAFATAVDRYASDHSTESDLDAEYIFLQLVAVFVGAIRCGAIDVEQSQEPLAHFGRFGPTYDAIVKKLVDVLRDEGIYNPGGATNIVGVIEAALNASFHNFVDGDNEDPAPTVNLARTVASAFVVQGTHFTVLRQIDGNDVRDMHQSLINHTFTLVASFVKQEKTAKGKENKAVLAKRRSRVLAFFRVLVHLVAPLNGKLALELLHTLQTKAEECGAPIGVTKAWDAYRIYEKRLLNIAAKDKGNASAAKTAAPRKAISAAADDSEPEQSEGLASQGSEYGEQDEGAGVDVRAMEVDEGADEEGVEDGADEGVGFDDADHTDTGAIAPQDFGFDLDEHGQLVDLDTRSPSPSQPRRERSVSVEPTAKRRKITKKY